MAKVKSVVKELIMIAVGLTIELFVFSTAMLWFPMFMGLYSAGYTLQLTSCGHLAIPLGIAVGMLAMLNGIVWYDDWITYHSPLFRLSKEE